MTEGGGDFYTSHVIAYQRDKSAMVPIKIREREERNRGPEPQKF
jgi:hypothetical protein